MYRAIVVDDEKWIVEGLKAGVGWSDYGFEVVGDADNGLEALKLIERLRPDIVLTDIKMPEMNGLELIKQGKTLAPDTLFVVLSGHAEFAYAQKALNYGTFGYCLKPFEIEEIHAMLKRLADTLAAQKSSAPAPGDAAELYEAICSGRPEAVRQLMETNGLALNEQAPVTPVVVQGETGLHAAPRLRYIGFRMSLKRHGYLVASGQQKPLLASLSEANGAIRHSIGIGYPVSDVAALEASLEAASLAAYGSFATGRPGIYSAPSTADSPLDDVVRRAAQSLHRNDRVQFAADLELARSYFRDGHCSIKDAYALFTSVMYFTPREGASAGGRWFEGYEQLHAYFGHADAMIDYLLEHTLRHFAEQTSDRVAGISHKKIKEIVLYIDRHFTEDVSIQSLSERFAISPNYLCQLFKKEVGDNFVEYVSRERIRYACRLLAETDLPIHLIGEKCGFHDYFYFTRIFKRMNHMTPTQYKESLKDGR